MKKYVTLLLAVPLFLKMAPVFACDALLKNYPQECALQDSYQQVKADLQNNFGVDAEYTATYRALRLIDEHDWDGGRRRLNHMPWKIYEPAPDTWILWERGAELVDQMVADPNLKALTIADIEKLNRVLISKAMMSTLARWKGNAPGKIRTSAIFLPPGAEFTCDRPMSAAAYKIISNYDLKDYEGNPLLRPKFFGKCANGGYKGQIWYLASSKVNKEMERWLEHFNTYYQKFINGEASDLTPLEFIVDSQRWFLAIHPFGDGNGRTSRFLQDFLLKKLGLPYMPTGRLSMLSTRATYLKDSYNEMVKSVNYLNTCLDNFENRKTNSRVAITGHCLPLYQDIDTGERSHLKQERISFGQKLRKSIDDLNQDGI
jgi:hypothetical protein